MVLETPEGRAPETLEGRAPETLEDARAAELQV
jgi:hypothetical protein